MSRADNGKPPALRATRPNSKPSDARSITAVRCVIGPLLLALQLAAPFVHAAPTAPTTNGPLRVVTTPIAPFVLPDTDPAQNADGSTDLYFGPKAPEGKARNWMATVPGKGYIAVIRLYGPTEAAIDKSWKPGDFEKIN